MDLWCTKIITNVFVQTVVLLYLIDNNDNTSWMILLGSGMGVVIEAWKVWFLSFEYISPLCSFDQITKAVDINLVPAAAGSVLPYTIEIKGRHIWNFCFDWQFWYTYFSDKHILSEDEKKTQEYVSPDDLFTVQLILCGRYDRLAFRYVSYVAIPLLAGYTIYSLLYQTHRGWYSFVISTLTSFVYMFGFVSLLETNRFLKLRRNPFRPNSFHNWSSITSLRWVVLCPRFSYPHVHLL